MTQAQRDPQDDAPGMTATHDFPTLRTSRLLLREIVAADAPALLEIHGDTDAMKWFGRDPITRLDEAEDMVEQFASLRTPPEMATGVRWGIELRAPGHDPALRGRLVGSCGLFRWLRGWQSCLVGYELARAAQGHGLMREALLAALQWGFEHMLLERVEAMVHVDNTPSLRTLGALGFVDEGVAREAGYWLGRRHDMVRLGLLRREFTAA